MILAVLAAATTGVGVSAAPAATTPDATTPAATTPAATTTPSPETTPAPAPNPTAPSVATGGVASLTRTTATLAGTVTPNNGETTYHFQYGTSTSYGLSSADQVVPAGSSAVAVTGNLSNLTVGTRYHYRITATNAAGTTSGSDKTFSTQSNPKAPSVSTLAATAITPTTAQLNGHVDPNGQPTNVSFQYGTSNKYGVTTPVASAGTGTSTVTSTIPIAGLTGNTQYHYRAVAVNATGTVRGGDHTFTTPRGLTGVGMSIVPNPVVWNTAAVVSGTVSGAGVGGVTVQLLQQDFPFAGTFRQVATQVASSAGAYSFSVSPVMSAVNFQVVTQTTTPVTSPVARLNVSLFSTLTAEKRSRTSYTLHGMIYPQIHKGRVSIQRRTPKGRWITVKRVAVSDYSTTASRFRATASRLSRKTTYRVRINPRDRGAHLVTTSATLSVPKRTHAHKAHKVHKHR